jgi:hypothetical protein
MTDKMEPARIATQLAQIRRDLGVADDIASNALRQTVKLLIAGLPFMLPVLIVTGDRSPLEIADENAEEPYTGVLLYWYANFISHPAWDIDEVTDFVGAARNAIDDQIALFFKQQPGVAPRSRRERDQIECDLCDDVMIRWLSATNRVQLFELALLWELHSLSNKKPGVLEDLGLTEDWMHDLPEPEIIKLELVERLAAENRQYLADLWNFICDDPKGADLKQHVFDVTNHYAATHGESP